MPYADPKKQAEYQAAWMQKRRVEWIRKNGPCARCGSSEDLEVDHVDAKTKVTHRVWSWSQERRNRELAKCQVLCKNCHVEKTAENGESPYGRQHGNVRLTYAQILTIRARYKAGGVTHRSLAAEYGIARSHVSNILNRKKRNKG